MIMQIESLELIISVMISSTSKRMDFTVSLDKFLSYINSEFLDLPVNVE